jgi:SAM-dependent methyltransferase
MSPQGGRAAAPPRPPVSSRPAFDRARDPNLVGHLSPRFNLVLDDEARALYRPAERALFKACPEMMARKIPRANVQQAFVLDAALNYLMQVERPRALCVGSFEDTACETIKSIGCAVDAIDPALNVDLATFRSLPTTLDGTYDLVFSTSVIEHVADDEAFVADIAALLKPDGVAVITMDFNDAWRPGMRKPVVDHRLYTIRDIVERLLPRMPGCRLVDEPAWDEGKIDFEYEGSEYAFATLVVRKEADAA